MSIRSVQKTESRPQPRSSIPCYNLLDYNQTMKVITPELLWHGGGNENGKPDPVYSVDVHPSMQVMSTSGIDANVPPKGSVRVRSIFHSPLLPTYLLHYRIFICFSLSIFSLNMIAFLHISPLNIYVCVISCGR